MFQDELCRHPDVQTVPYSPHTYLETHWWLMAAVLLGQPAVLYNSRKPYDGYGSARNARAYMIELLDKCVPSFVPPKDDKELVYQGWEELCRAYASPVFFEKSPQTLAQWAALSLLLEWVERTMCDVKIIGLVRNPHAVMYSARQLFASDPAKRQFAWLAGCRNMLTLEQMLPPDQFMRVRYEDLVADPIAGFAAIAEFVGISPDPVSGSGANSRSTAKWRSDMGYRLELHSSVDQMARFLGYQPAELLNNVTSLPSQAAGASKPAPKRLARRWLNRRRDRLVQPMLLRIRNVFRSQS